MQAFPGPGDGRTLMDDMEVLVFRNPTGALRCHERWRVTKETVTLLCTARLVPLESGEPVRAQPLLRHTDKNVCG